MAGGKETPRQKMIGMMYLVLTAMLALQVSSAIIEKFILLNNSLELTSGAANKVNQESVLKIQATVDKSGNRAADVAVLKQAEDVRKVSAEIIGELDNLKKELIESAGGGFNEDGAIKNPAEEEKVAQIMIGGNKNGKAYDLKNQLNAFIDKLNGYSSNPYGPIALDGSEDPIAKDNKDQRNKDFAQLNFAQTPVAAALAVLSQKQIEVRRIEGEVLNQLASKIGAADIKFDRTLAMISAESKVVAAGTPFKGDMFIAASASGITPRMSLNGAPVKVENGVGKIEFIAQGGNYDNEGLSRRELKGTISFPTPTGRDTTITLSQEYFVAKPTYQYQTANVPGLYLGCANKLSVQSPSLGALWAPTFRAEGAEVIPGAKKGEVTVVPNRASVDLSVINQGNVLGTDPFKVQRVPKPTIELRINNAAYDRRRGAAASSARSVQVVAIPDEGFKNFSPEDARFRVSQIEISLARGSRRVAGPLSLAGGGSISSLAQQAQAGDRYVIEIKRVERQNFKGQVSTVELGNLVEEISLN